MTNISPKYWRFLLKNEQFEDRKTTLLNFEDEEDEQEGV
jgi:hypothetical protein